MKTSLKGKIALVVSEGIVDTPYLDAATPPVWTVGVGVTKAAGHVDPEKNKGRVFTVPEIMDMFEDVLPKYEKPVNDLVKVPLTQNEFDALVHFVYNVGEGGFKRSKLLKLINDNKKATAFQTGFHGWMKPASLKGRRDKERDIALNANYGSTVAPLFGVNKSYKPVKKGTVDVAAALRTTEVTTLPPTPAPEPVETKPKPVPTENKPPVAATPEKSDSWIVSLLKLVLNLLKLFKKK